MPRISLTPGLAVLLVLSPSGVGGGPPKGAPQGVIASVGKAGVAGDDFLAECLVKGVKHKDFYGGEQEVVVRIARKTKLEKVVGKKRVPATAADLKKGAKVEFSGYGFIVFTLPAIVYPSSVVIL